MSIASEHGRIEAARNRIRNHLASLGVGNGAENIDGCATLVEGLVSPTLSGNAAVGDVIKGQTFYNTNAKSKQTGTLELTGNAAVGDVLKNATFYNTNAKSKQTGTLELTGNATASDVRSGKTFYSTNAKTKLTGTLVSKTLYEMVYFTKTWNQETNTLVISNLNSGKYHFFIEGLSFISVSQTGIVVPNGYEIYSVGNFQHSASNRYAYYFDIQIYKATETSGTINVVIPYNCSISKVYRSTAVTALA